MHSSCVARSSRAKFDLYKNKISSWGTKFGHIFPQNHRGCLISLNSNENQKTFYGSSRKNLQSKERVSSTKEDSVLQRRDLFWMLYGVIPALGSALYAFLTYGGKRSTNLNFGPLFEMMKNGVHILYYSIYQGNASIR